MVEDVRRPTEPARRGGPSPWRRLLLFIGATLLAFVVANMVVRGLQAPATLLQGGMILRLVLFTIGGAGLIVGWPAARWVAVVALGTYTTAGAAYAVEHFDPWLVVGLLTRAATVVVLLRPEAGAALSREAQGASPTLPMWVSSTMSMSIPLMFAQSAEVLVKALMGMPVLP